MNKRPETETERKMDWIGSDTSHRMGYRDINGGYDFSEEMEARVPPQSLPHEKSWVRCLYVWGPLFSTVPVHLL
ncbi:hypothetical protein V6N13_144176 [Hibiscus sabdariffa]|uniref:Uncharacterized protein n=1 Tax=Hibiscus sabdariffa TaxID=183260 RepID=A0ABR2FJK8_9ROSI